MKPIKKLDNAEFVERVMNYSKHGSLMHLFVLEAMNDYSNKVILQEEQAEKDEENTGMGLINRAAWAACAKELQEKLTERYDG